MNRSRIRIPTLCLACCLSACGTFERGNKDDETAAEIRQVPGKAEYVIFGPHRLRANLAITGLPEGASEETIAAARAGTYNGPVVWTLEAWYTFPTDAHRALDPQVTVHQGAPEEVVILLPVVTPKEEIAGLQLTRARVQTEFTASPQAEFRVRVVENKQ